jgi:Zn-dependent peptidase ImmA (M78 family)
MGLRRGFKTEANGLARDLRADLSLAAADPLDPFRLATFLDIPVHAISELEAVEPEAIAQLTRHDPSAFSAVTVFEGVRKSIWHNDGHALVRQRSNVAHELAHALLLHSPGTTSDSSRARAWDAIAEEEAHWAGAALLVSDEAAFSVAYARTDLVLAAAIYGVSTDLMTFRLNVSGALARAARARAKKRS